jgi:flagellar L-ring protein precursor FlgH
MTKPVACVFLVLLLSAGVKGAERKAPQLTVLDQLLAEDEKRGSEPAKTAASGSLWSPSSRLADIGSDPRATQLDDLVTIVVSERASAVASGTTKSARASSAANSIGALAGLTKATGPLANLTNLSGSNSLSGEGTTSRETVLTTNLTARVTRVLPNGVLLVEGTKSVQVNSEQQVVLVRGLVRPSDISAANTVASDRISNLEVRINGKGVVGDAVRRPFFLYRLILGLMPF